MTKVGLLLLIMAAANSCIGNILLKKSRTVLSNDAGLFEQFISAYFISGIFFYVLNVFLFAKALDHAQVNVAYPILASTSFIMLAFASSIFIDEAITPQYIMGLSLVIAGIILLSISN